MLLQENKPVVLIKGYTNRKNFKIEMCTTKTNQENPTNQQINKKKPKNQKPKKNPQNMGKNN